MPPSARALLLAISCAVLCACPAPPASFRVVDLDEAKRLVETREVVLVEAPEIATAASAPGEPNPPGAAVLVFGVSESATRARAAALARAGNHPVLVFVPRDVDERGVIALVGAVAGAVAARGFCDSLVLNLISTLMGAVGGLLTYGRDRLLAPRLSGLARTLVYPAAVVTLDFLMSFGPNGTLGISAYSQYNNMPLGQIVSVAGLWGLSFLIAWCGPVVNEIWEQGLESHSALRIGATFLGILLAVLAFGNLRLAFALPVSQTVRVAGLAADRSLWQGLDIPSHAKVAAGTDELRASVRAETAPLLDDLFTRTRQEAQAGAKIVSWSEAAGLVLKEDEPAVIERTRALAQEEKIYLQMALVVYLRTDHFPYSENRAIMIATGLRRRPPPRWCSQKPVRHPTHRP